MVNPYQLIWRPLDKVREEKFQASYRAEIRNLFLITSPMILLDNVLFMCFWDTAGNVGSYSLALPFRLVINIGLSIVWLIMKASLLEKYYELILAGLICIGVSCVVFIIFLTPLSFLSGSDGLILTILFCAFLIRCRVCFLLPVYLFITALTIFLMLESGLSKPYFVRQLLSLFSAVVLALAYVTLQEWWARGVFVLNQNLIEERDKSRALAEIVRKAKAERFEWLENVAAFLKHELKNQILGVQQSLILMQKKEQRRDSIYLTRAESSLKTMRQLINTAVEANDIESALAKSSKYEVDYSSLVKERVKEFEDFLEKEIKLKVEPNLLVHGDRSQLILMLDKLISNADEHGDQIGEISVNLTGDHINQVKVAKLEIVNKGQFPTYQDALFQPFPSKSENRNTKHQGLGLFVAKRISESHDGWIKINSDVPEGIACVVIILPLGQSCHK